MNWSGIIKLRASASIACPLDPSRYCVVAHSFVVEQTAQTPLLLAEERDIRAKLQEQLDCIVAKFLEAHK